MIRYKLNIFDALSRAGFTTYTAKRTGLIAQGTMKKIQTEDPGLSLETLNKICALLDLQPKDLIEYVPTDADREMISSVYNMVEKSQEKETKK